MGLVLELTNWEKTCVSCYVREMNASSPQNVNLTADDLYIFSATTAGEKSFFGNSHRVSFLHDSLIKLSNQYGWRLHAWSILPNEYSFIAAAPEVGAVNVERFVKHLHTSSERFVNVLDNRRGRRVWKRGTCDPAAEWASYENCLADVHALPVLRGLVPSAEKYPWSSAREQALRVG